MLSGWNSAKLSAQSPPCNKYALPSATSAKAFLRDLTHQQILMVDIFLFYLILDQVLSCPDKPPDV